MKSENSPETPATRFLRQHGIAYSSHLYAYEEHGGTRVSSRELNVDEHAVIKTLVMEDEGGSPLIVLMHGDKEVSTKALARILGVKSIHPCDPKTAERHTGYRVGGTSPFGLKKPLPLYMEETIPSLPRILINAGSRGLLAEMPPSELVRVLNPAPVRVAI